MKVAAGPDIATTWQSAASPGGLIGILGIVLSLVLAGGTLVQITGHTGLPIPVVLSWLFLLVLVALAAALAVLVYGYATISYEFSSDVLVIRWAWQRHVIELSSIQQILPAVDRLGDNPARWQRFWTGYYVSAAVGPSGPVTVVATLPVRRQLLIVTADQQFAISPERPVLFVEEFERLRRALDDGPSGAHSVSLPGEEGGRLAEADWAREHPVIAPRGGKLPPPAGAEQPLSNGSNGREAARPRERTIFSRPHVLNDPVALSFLGIAVLLNAVMVVFILVRYDSLPSSIALHWNVNGDPDRIGSPREIWVVPIITALVAIANLILAWSIETFDRFAARFLLASSCMVQVVAWVALITLIR